MEAPEGNFTHAEIERLSNQLAQRLSALGVRSGSLVGISLPRGAGELVALLATSKAGGAYVPLDPAHPLARLQLVLEDAAPQVLLVHPESPLAGLARQIERVIVFEDLTSATAGQPDLPLQVRHEPGQLAYVLFTSGSTGRPKGVEITRGAFSNFLASMAHTPGMSESDRLLAITTTSFDIAGLELFLPLLVGGTVVIADRPTTQDSRLLRRLLEGSAISIMQATPAMWRLLLHSGWSGDSKLRMLCGGEALPPALADRLLAAGGELWNMYGPTETTVWSTLARIQPGYDRITIGRPIDETVVRVLDESLQPVPVGQEGELCIGGSGLARGYRGRSDLTAQRFVNIPGDTRTRYYRTGDLSRELPDGRFECLGRLDHQVKVRGFRIELGEIEAVLAALPGVSEVIVVADQREDGDPLLAAYWVGSAARDALIAEARRRLPAYMVPAAFVPLPALPLNTNGKVDRKQLPPAADFQPASPHATRPRNDQEARIAAVWRDVLGLEEVSVDESFFHLGGTSVLALETLVRMELELGIELPLQAFFEAPTVEGLAARIGGAFSADDPIVVWLQRGTPEVPPLFCLFGIQLYQDLALALSGEHTVIGMHVPFRHVPGRDPRPSLPQITARYIELIRRHQPLGPYHLLGFCFGGVVAYEVGCQLEQQGQEVRMVVVLDAILPNAVVVDWSARFRSYLLRAWKGGPREFGSLARKLGQRIARRLPGLGRFRVQPVRGAPGLIDLPVDGPEVDAMLAEVSRSSHRLQGRLLVIRATGAERAQWQRVAADHGWGGRSEQVLVHDMATTHMEVLGEPHVRSLAAAIQSSWDAPAQGQGDRGPGARPAASVLRE